mgnify:CR=1 FL=1
MISRRDGPKFIFGRTIERVLRVGMDGIEGVGLIRHVRWRESNVVDVSVGNFAAGEMDMAFA